MAGSCGGRSMASRRNLFDSWCVYLIERHHAESWLKALKSDADERILVEAAKRDPARFGELYQRNVYQVYAYVSRRVGTREEAEDITSDVFHHALENLKKFEWRGAP